VTSPSAYENREHLTGKFRMLTLQCGKVKKTLTLAFST